jgi:hypothetical protein
MGFIIWGGIDDLALGNNKSEFHCWFLDPFYAE